MGRTQFLAIPLAAAVLLLMGCGKADDPFNLGDISLFGDPTPLPEATVEALQAVTGDELELKCPPTLLEAVEPTRLAEEMDKLQIPTYVPGPEELGLTPEAFTGAGTLCSLLPPDPMTGELLDYCSPEPNEQLGVQFGGGFALEAQLVEMGRLCGATVGGYGRGNVHVRLDKYKAVAGANEAFRREAVVITPTTDLPPWPLTNEQRAAVEANRKCEQDANDRMQSNIDHELLESIGEDRELQVSVGTMNDQCWIEQYAMLIRRRNIVARMDFALDFGSPGQASLVPSMLEYAAQLDRNIEAAAAQQQSQ
jgi:hypothetical protein